MAKRVGRVLARGLNVRVEPNIEEPPIDVLRRGHEVLVLEDLGRWLRIRRRETEGFVGARFVRVQEEVTPLMVDASHWNDEPDWVPMADDDRFCGAMLKATEGTSYSYASSWFNPHWKALKAAGGARYGTSWFRAAYHYLIFAQPGDRQADYYLDVIEEAGGWDAGDLPPVVDVELGRADSPNRNASAEQGIACTRAFAHRIAERTGRLTILYGRNAMRGLDIRDPMGCRYLWSAGYTQRMPSTTSIGWPREQVLFWQYTNGELPQTAEPIAAPGVGPCDVNRFLRGDESAIAALCAERADDVPPPIALWSIRQLQEILTELDYRPGVIDGIDGPNTRRALNAFRRHYDIDAQGPLDALTQTALEQARHRSPEGTPAVSSHALKETRRFLPHPELLESTFRPMVRELADYMERVRSDEPVPYAEAVARTAEWLFELGIEERRGANRGPWVDFLRGVGGGIPEEPNPWCAFFVSACLRIAHWAGEYPDLDLALSPSASMLYIAAPDALRTERDALALDSALRGSIFVRGRMGDSPLRRQQILNGARNRAHAGIVVEVDGQNLVTLAGNSTFGDDARGPHQGSVAIETLGPDGDEPAQRAWGRLVGVVRYQAEAPKRLVG